MHVSISGDIEFITALAQAGDERIEVESVKAEQDRTEQEFGLIELGVLVAIVKNAYDLSQAIVKAWRAKHSPKKQTLRVRSGVATYSIELDDNVDVETLRRALEPLFEV